jgi:ABC-2 type transport system permease protein
MLKTSFSEAVAYRAEMAVWVLATTMPLIMMALWTAVARDAPVGRFGAAQFGAYFLATFIARQLTGSWISWQINFDIRQGTLAVRLLRPIHPIFAYASEIIAALPLRVVVALPVAAILLLTTASQGVTRDPMLWGAWVIALIGGWLVTYFINVLVGSLALFIGSSLKFMEGYYALFFVLGGYTIPVELFPAWLRHLNDWLPFRYQLGVAVEIITGRFDRAGALHLLGQQFVYVGALATLALWVWNRGMRRFAAYGG